MTALLSVPQIFVRPNSARKRADEMKALFAHPDGDHLTMLNVYHAFKSEDAQADAFKWCRDHFLSLRALQSADSVRAQLKRIMERNDLDLVSTPFEDRNYYTNIRRALVAGFFMQVAKKGAQGKSYVTVKDNQDVLIHPSTVLGQDSEWLIYNEFVLTSKNYIRTVTQVKPEWLMVCSEHSSILDNKSFDNDADSICLQELAPIYYDISTFSKGEVKTALERVLDKQKRKIKGESKRR